MAALAAVSALPACSVMHPKGSDCSDPCIEAITLPERPRNRISPVLWFRFDKSVISPVEKVFLVEGEVSASSGRQLLDDVWPDSLRARVQETTVFSARHPDATFVAPHHPLEVDQFFTVVVPTLGWKETFRTVDTAAIISRSWPPEGYRSSSAVWCDETTAPPNIGAEADADLRLGTGVDATIGGFAHCVHHVFRDAPISPPGLIWGGHWANLQPAQAPHASLPPTVPASCAQGSHAVGFGCLTIEDDRLQLTGENDPLLWALASPSGVAVFVTHPKQPQATFRGLLPGSRTWVAISNVGLDGVWRHDRFDVLTSAARPRVTISEVMANPSGPEPQQEWLELHNDGSAAANLSKFRLRDEDATIELPAVWLGPDARALITNEGFDRSLLDQAPPEPCVVRVTALGANGLRNQGERLQLLDADGEVVSQFAAAIAKSGLSRSAGSAAGDSYLSVATPCAINARP